MNMGNNKKNVLRGFLGFIPVLLVTFLLWKLYASCMNNLNDRFEQINRDIQDKATVVLSPNTDSVLLKQILYDNGYCETERDAAFIAKTLVDSLQGGNIKELKSLYSLQRRDVGQVSAKIADSCHVLNTILSVSREKIGVANDIVFQYISPSDSGLCSISVKVERELPKTSSFQFRTRKEPCVGVPVRLQMHYRDSLHNPQVLTLGYVSTDDNGVAAFECLCADSSYSFLPINEGFEYGRSQGVIGGDWNNEDRVFKFVEKEHRIQLLTNTALRQIKNERTVIVRTPDEFKEEFYRSRRLVVLSWWVLSVVMAFFFRRERNCFKGLWFIPKRMFDIKSGLIVACCMFLSGLSVLMMFSMVDPVNDEIRGLDMTIGVLYGVLGALLLQFMDFVKQFNRGKFPFCVYDFLRRNYLRGVGWFVAALVLTMLLFTPLGREVGGMKVNLQIPGLPLFQPSEIAKYLVILFSSIFFVENIDRIIHYSDEFDTDLKKKLQIMGLMVSALVGLMFLYRKLGDMGPGLVLGIAFVLQYSFCKSKQDMRYNDQKRWKKLLKSDLMMLVYGVVSFALALLLARWVSSKSWYIIGLAFWLVVWLFFGAHSIRRGRLVYRKQVHETAIIMNLVIFIFIWGSNAGRDSGVLKRLEERTSMCTNTWGGMDRVFYEIEHDGLTQDVIDDPVSNTQVANGLWALASGGFKGQGWGNGKPSVIPAFHTDMILSSIGEQKGWLGLAIIIIVYWLLLRSVARKGIETGAPLAIFLCMGIAIVTAVQLFVIALGSSGAIPLTGVSVPFLSYGRVSMILNIVAFGLALSLVTRVDQETASVHQLAKKNNVDSCHRPYRVAAWMFRVFALFTLGVWAKYQWSVFQRNKTLIQPAFVINVNGDPVLEYNPRIGLITSEMYAGRIFDSKGLLLATSNKEDISGAIQDSLVKSGIETDDLLALKRRHLKRYYPFAEQLFFMVGDQNTKLMFSYDENHPVGYMAEVQHLSYLRGFDNRLLDKNKNQAKIRVVTDKKRDSRFLKPSEYTSEPIPLYDYSPLLPYLKDGSGHRLEKRNEEVENGKYDLFLTVDAALQKDIQENLEKYMKDPREFGNQSDVFVDDECFNFMRVSVVVLDAKNGNLLASANYPQPDYERLGEELLLRKEEKRDYYNDGNKENGWTAYTDCDLGTTFQTAPGSTAKVMSAMAGLKKLGKDAAEKKYYISKGNIIENGKFKEPNSDDSEHDGRKVSMETAIVKSSNCYFINLVNENDLYPYLDTIYRTIGASVSDIVPYYYMMVLNEKREQAFRDTVKSIEKIALRRYASFCAADNKDSIKMNKGEWKWAWGHGFGGYELKASPLNMARLASAVVNNGVMQSTQFVKNENLRQEDSVQLLGKVEADTLKYFMKKETANHKTRRAKVPTLPSNMGGKTGTAERTFFKIGGRAKGVDINDGWYMFFIEGDNNHHSLAVAVRMERNIGSSSAVRLSGKMLLDVLKEHGYIQ